MGSRIAAITALALACGGGPHGGPAELPQPRVVSYKPLGFQADAKNPRLAVILGTDAHDGSTVIPLAPPATTPNPGASVAAIVAATLLGKDVTDLAFPASAGAASDGASASGLIAAGFLATLTGAELDPKVTLIGSLDADGTLGPVRGLPDQFLAAIAQGKTRLGYPPGMRTARSEATGEDVDLVALAKAHGAEAVEVADVRAAYALLTGKHLPEVVPFAEAEMALDAGTTAALEAKYQAWEQRLAKEWAAIVQLDSAGRLPALLGTLRDDTKHAAELAQRLHAKGLVGPAYEQMLLAWTYATSTNTTYDLLQKVKKADLEGAVAELDALASLQDDVTAAFHQIAALTPRTLGGHLQMIAAFKTALRSDVYRHMASQVVDATRTYLRGLAQEPLARLGAADTAERVVAAVAPSVVFLGRARASTALAVEELAFERDDGVPYTCAPADVKRVAVAFAAAGAAGLAYLDANVVAPGTRRPGVADDEARTGFAVTEPAYLIASIQTGRAAGGGLAKELEAAWGEASIAAGMLALASSELAYFDTVALIAKYDALGVHTDANHVVRIEHARAFEQLLASAERTARASARAAKIAAGAIPIQARLAYQSALSERDGDLAEKVDALGEFWEASAASQTAVMLARNQVVP